MIKIIKMSYMDYMDIVFECKIEKRYTKTISINNPYDITIIH